MEIKRCNYAICIMYFIMPLYFKTDLGFALPFLMTPFIFLIVSNKLSNLNFMTGFLLFYTFLFFLQITLIQPFEIESGVRKYITILSFIVLYSASGMFYNKLYDKYIITSFIIVFIYGIYSSLSYIGGYENYLIPGTCESNNLSIFLHLRCSTFGEGNYYGNYIALIAILYADNKKIAILSFISSLISFSPAAIIITFYILFKKYKIILKFTILMVLIFAILRFDNVMLSMESQTSSFGERLEFIKVAIVMGFDNIFLGVGMGQYGFNLSKYTDFQHLIDASLKSVRYIPNSNLGELFSEQGLFGIFFYFMFLKKFSSGKIGTLSNRSIIYLIIIIGLAMPTLYLYFFAVLSGAISAKLKMSYMNSAPKSSSVFNSLEPAQI